MSSPERESAGRFPPVPADAPEPEPAGDLSAEAARLAVCVERELSEGRTDMLTVEAIQLLMAAACTAYAAKVEAGVDFQPLANQNRVSDTAVMMTAGGLLRAADLEVFELGMWQSWTGR